MAWRDKKLYRSRSERMVGGVCGGLAEYTGIDTAIWRVIMLLVALPGGISILLYLIMWIVIPLEPKRKQVRNEAE